MDLATGLEQCAHGVHQDTMRRIITVESSHNPWAIAVVGGRLQRQPRNESEAVATAKWLASNGYNYSVGYAQVNQVNFARFGMNPANAFDVCLNLYAGSQILSECYERARAKGRDEQNALRDAFSCYYSGNFKTGYRTGYVALVVGAGRPAKSTPNSGSEQRKSHRKETTTASYAIRDTVGDSDLTTSGQDEMVTIQAATNSALLF